MAQCVIVTGGASGIGRAITERFLAAGATVHVCEIDPAHLADVQSAHPDLGGTVADVANPDDVSRMVDEAAGRMGRIDTLVNNAAIPGPRAPIEEMPLDEWYRTMRVNLDGPFHTVRAVVPHMKAQGGGAIVNISTVSVRTIPWNRSVYNTSKAGLEGLTRTLARELGPFNIRVNAIQPGMVNNPRMRTIVQRIADQEGRPYEETEQGFLEYISMRCKIEPKEIADMAVFLSSERAPHVTGQIVSVDGFVEWER